MKKAINIYCIFVGICMIALWVMLLTINQVPELAKEPYRIAAHIISEIITALLLIAGGILAFQKKPLGGFLRSMGLGALLYSVFTAGGYYLQLGNTAMTAMFACLFVLTVVCIVSLAAARPKNGAMQV